MAWARPGWSAVGLLVAYYAVPVTWNSPPQTIAFTLFLTIAGLILLGSMMLLELRAVRGGRQGRSDRVVVMMLMLVVVAFSLTFYLMALLAPQQMSGLHTRTDALYFTLSTMATVGYGDVHASGQASRAVVCVLIVFSAVVVATVVRAHISPGRPQD